MVLSRVNNANDSMNRFKWARVQVKKVTLRQVEDETGLMQSMLISLESSNTRDVGYSKIKTLAEYYEVSMDWLCGILPFDNWSLNKDARVAAAYTGLSSDALKHLAMLNEALNRFPTSDELGLWATNMLDAYNYLLSNQSGHSICHMMYDYVYADFSKAYLDYLSEPGPSLKPKQISDSNPVAFLRSDKIRFIMKTRVSEETGHYYSFGLSPDDYGEVIISMINHQLRTMRDEIQNSLDKET